MHSINWLGLWTLYKREVWRFFKVINQTILAPMVTTLLMLAILVMASGGAAHDIKGIPFEQFIAPGLIMMAVIQNAFANTSSSLILSKIQGVIIDVLMPPLSGTELTLAYAMGGVTRGLMVGVAVAAGLYMFVPMTLYHPGIALLYLLLASMLMALLGVLAGVYAQTFDHIATFTNFLITPLAFLSGTFYSIDVLPPFWQHVSHANPFFFMNDGIRYAFTGHADAPIALGLAVLTVLNLLLWGLVQHLITKGWRLKT